MTTLVGLLTALVSAVIGAILGYWLGHRQTRNEQEAEVLIELRRRFLKLTDQFLVFSVPLPSDTSRLEQIEAMHPGIDGMVNYFHSERMYLSPRMTEKARWISGGFLQHFDHMSRALRADVAVPPTDSAYHEAFALARHEMEKWRETKLPQLLEDLEDEIRGLRGTRETLWDVILELFGRRV